MVKDPPFHACGKVMWGCGDVGPIPVQRTKTPRLVATKPGHGKYWVPTTQLGRNLHTATKISGAVGKT